MADDQTKHPPEELSDIEAVEHSSDTGASESALTTDTETESPSTPRTIAPGHPDPENVVFVLVGVLLTLFVIYRAAAIFGG